VITHYQKLKLVKDVNADVEREDVWAATRVIIEGLLPKPSS
jgi:hypothetical protein